MIRFALKRLLQIIPTLFVAMTVIFFMMKAVPGGPLDKDRRVPAEVEKQLDAYYHLDEPPVQQYERWLGRVVLHGDLGPTFKYPNRSVNEIIGASLPISIELGGLAMLFALLLGIPLGMLGALKQNTGTDHAAMGVAMLGISIPRFVLAPLLVLVLSLKLYLFPVARWDSWRHMVLPVFCAGLPVAAYVARLTRGGMLDVIRSDFVRTARAKGASELRVVWKHAARGALLPVISFLGPGMSGLLVGSLVVEKIFDIPGMGRYFVEAAANRETNLLLGVALVYGVLLMVFNLLVDLAYAVIDPRVELK